MRLDGNLFKTVPGGVDTRHRGQKIEVRMGAPGVAIGARWFRFFRPGREAQGEHLFPRPKQAEVFVAQPGLLDGAEKVKAEVVRALGQRGIRQDFLHHALLILGGDGAGQDAQDVGMLAEAFARRSIRQQAA